MKVATIGFFDGVHTGHQFLINRLKDLAKERKASTIVVTFASSPSAVIGGQKDMKLLTPDEEKLELLHTAGIDEVMVYDFTAELSQMSAHDFMQQVLRDQLGVTTLVLGYDHTFGCSSKGRDYKAYGQELGMEILSASAYGDVSSSAVRTLLHDGDIEGANSLLGYHYRIQGTVVPGKQLGRTIGFPTANISVSQMKQLPKVGAYEVSTTIDGDTFRGMMNIGSEAVEVHLIDFQGNLYGQTLTVQLIRRLRDEIHFPDLKSLQEQLTRDLKSITQTNNTR